MHDYFNTKVITKVDVEKILGDYYDERGWDVQKGTPTPQKLKELGLEQYSSEADPKLACIRQDAEYV
jgi:hypothetical protein